MPIHPTPPFNPFAFTGEADAPRDIPMASGVGGGPPFADEPTPTFVAPPAPPVLAPRPTTPASPRTPSLLGQAMPLLALALARGNPQVMAASLAGWMQGKRAREEAALVHEDRVRKRQLEAAEFYTRAAQSLATIDDPVVHAQTVAALEPMLQFHGLTRDALPFNDQKLAARTKKEAADLLDALDKKHPTGNYSADWKDPKTGAVRRVTRAELAQIAGQAAFGPGGQSIGPEKVPAPRQEPMAGSFEDYVARYAKGLGKTVEQLTAKDIEAAREKYRLDDQSSGGGGFISKDVTALTAAGLDMAALNYKKTGVMPPLGMGDRTTRQRIINRAAELTSDDMARIAAGVGDVAANRADFAANQASLTQLQKQRDAITSFEQTAQKNIDIFLAQAEKVADIGIPLLNRPIRWASGEVLGSPEQTAYDAARQVAINEIAKIVSNPNMTGVLSDSARHEVEAFNPRTATLKQSIAVMRLLKRDMQNRAHALDETLAEIRGRIRSGGRRESTSSATPRGDASRSRVLPPTTAPVPTPQRVGRFEILEVK